jgi:hypothetical protein
MAEQLSWLLDSHELLSNPTEVRKAVQSTIGTYESGNFKASDSGMLEKAIETLSNAFSSDTLSDADKRLLDDVWTLAFAQD